MGMIDGFGGDNLITPDVLQANQSDLRAGDEVVIGNRDLNTIQQLQIKHGGWSESAMECLVGPCKLIQGIGGDAIVRAPSGSTYRLNSELLVKYNKPATSDPNSDGGGGDWRVVTSDESRLLAAMPTDGDSSDRREGWLEELRQLLGQRVELVHRASLDGRCTVRHNARTYSLDETCFEVPTRLHGDGHHQDNIESMNGSHDNNSSNRVVVTPNDAMTTVTVAVATAPVEGATVAMTSSIERMKQLQEGHGGWCDLMELLLGEQVVVKHVFEDGDLCVSRHGMQWLVNAECCTPASLANENSPVTQDALVSSDIENSRQLQQFQIATFAGKCGTMETAMPTGDVRVNIDDGANSVPYNARLLTRITNDRESRAPILVGDVVKLLSDKDRVIALQLGHGGWTDMMTLLLGQRGHVKSIFPDGDLRVSIMGTKIKLNPECVVKIEESLSNSDSHIVGDVAVPALMAVVKTMQAARGRDPLEYEMGSTACSSKVPPILGRSRRWSRVSSLLLMDKESRVDSGSEDLGDSGPPPSITSTSTVDTDADARADSALHVAVRLGQIDTCRQLLASGADVNAQNRERMTPIMCAVQRGDCQELLVMLVQYPGANLDIGDCDKDTALHLAMQNSRIESVQTLLQHGADLRAVNSQQFSPYHIAALRGQYRILELCLQREGASIVDLQKNDKFAAIHLATLNNHPNCLELLIKNKADLNIRNNKLQTALHIAVSQKNMACIRILVENKAELNLWDENGDTPLHDAIRVHNMDKMKQMSSLFGLYDMFELMDGLQHGSDKPEDIVFYLVENGASLDTLNHSGKSPLTACKDKSLQVKLIKFQIEKGSKSSSRDPGPPSVPIVPETKSRDEELEELRMTIEKLQDEKKCVICCDNRINVTFGCGHMTCDVCANNLFECHMCRAKIERKIRIFE